MHIDEYEPGRIRIDGHDERADLTLSLAGLRRGWWRKEGHELAIDDLDVALDRHPRTVVVGSGAPGRIRPHPDLAQALRERATEMELLPSATAVVRSNELIEQGEPSWAGALNLTC